jgi:hypothetical protein
MALPAALVAGQVPGIAWLNSILAEQTAWTANKNGGSFNLTGVGTLSVNTALGIGAAPTYFLDVYGSVAGIVAGRVRNGNNGAASFTMLRLGNDADSEAGILRNSSGNSSYGGANCLSLYTLNAHPISFVAGNSERMRITGAGRVMHFGTPVYADNAAAVAGGLAQGTRYRTAAGVVMEVL